MSTRVAENRQHTLVPCDHMATEQTAVVGRALQDRRTGADDIKDGKDTELRNKEVIPTVDLSVEVKRRESEQEQISMRSGSQQEVNQDKVHANQQTETVVESPFTTVIPTETTVREEADSNSVLSTGGSERVFTAMQMCNSSILRVSLKLEETLVEAAVDTAAEVTIISDKVYATLEPRPRVLKETMMHAAGRGMVMKTVVVGPVYLKIGSRSYATEVYVAPIKDDMLLGLNFMMTYGVVLDLKNHTLSVEGEQLDLASGPKGIIPVVSKVVVTKRTVVPPHSVVHVPAQLEREMKQYVIEPCNENLPILIPRCLYNNQNKPVVCLVNASDRYFTIKSNTVVGRAEDVQDTEQFVRATCVTEASCGESPVPEELTQLINNITTKLTSKEKQELRTLLLEFQDIFSRDEFDIGTFKKVEHSIDTGAAQPIKQRMRRTPLQFVKEEKQQLSRMLAAGVIEPSVSEWASAPVLIRKTDGKVRYAIDYRRLNAVTRKDVYPLPLIEECLDTLVGNEWFSKLDANSAYWQVRVKEEDQPKTAFITKYGLYQFTRMSFGLCNAPSTYARAMDLVLRGLNWQIVLCFLDDILVMGKNFHDHLCNLRAVFERFRQYGIKLKPHKCDLCKQEVSFLGRTVNKCGMAIGEEYVEAIRTWKVPTSTKEVEQFLGFVNYHRNFIKGYSAIAKPLTLITGKKPFEWGHEQQKAYDTLKSALQTTPVLTLPNSTDKFILDTDASDNAIGAELLQVQDGQERVVAYGSFTLSAAQRRYCTTRKELLAVVRFTQHFRHYLLGREFLVRTDHSSLQWLMNFKEPQGQLARWLEVLSQYHMQIQHRSGKKHVNADVLSRLYDNEPCKEMSIFNPPTSLPCGGCKYCVKVHEKWQDFIKIDNVIPLAEKRSMGMTEEAVSVNTVATSYGIQYTTDQLSAEQAKDQDLQLVLHWLNSQEEPAETDLFLADQAAKKYHINREQFFLDSDGVLRNRSKNNLTRLVVPKPYIQEVLSLNHDLPMTGHQGIDRTRARIKEKFYWYKMNETIKAYVQACAVCNKNKKPTRKAKCPLSQYHAGVPLERVHIDFMGPLPETLKGNTNILVMVDQFTKWVEIIPLPSQTAEETARALVDQVFTRIGCPLTIHSDQGRNFESSLFKSICEAFHIHKTRTTPYRPCANGQVERFNRTVMDAVRCFVSDSQTDWDNYLPQLAGAIRSSVNRMTGLTPNMMMYGREVNMPADLVFQPPATDTSTDETEYVCKLKEASIRAHEIARQKLKTSHSYMKRDYDVRIRQVQYKPGDLVYILNMANRKGKSKKLESPWKGPGVVLAKITSYVYKVQLEKMITVINHDRMKRCGDLETPTWVKKKQKEVIDGVPANLDTDDLEIFCFCRKGDNGSFMIQCDMCDEWYHGDCVGVSAELADNWTEYFCPTCQRKSV